MKKSIGSASILLCFMLVVKPVFTQMITGNWRGRINKQRVELKIILNGDSLTGTSYYYESASNYRRYSIKGYFDPQTNSAIWWDDQLIAEKTGRFSLGPPGKIPQLASADFNCPGGGKMMLDGKSGKKEENPVLKGDIHLEKTESPYFNDEWDFVIENYTAGANNPDIIDSVNAIAFQPVLNDKIEVPGGIIQHPAIVKVPPVIENLPEKQVLKKGPAVITAIQDLADPAPIEEKFTKRKKILTSEIPVSGDSIELRFYDNAEIDGDSISLFLNDQLIFQHIRLTGNAYIIKLAVSGLKETSELIMVAENMGSIPPNTSYMVALVGDKRYDAHLESTTGSSAMVRFVKKSESP